MADVICCPESLKSDDPRPSWPQLILAGGTETARRAAVADWYGIFWSYRGPE